MARKPNRRYPCIFVGPGVRATDDRIQTAWKARHGQGAPFGSLRQEWRRQHCAVINPYGSDGCPYTIDQCISAFEAAVMATLEPQVIDSRVYFISVARSRGLERAENKPSSRITEGAGPGVAGVVGQGDPARRRADLFRGAEGPTLREVEDAESRYLRRRMAKPTRIGEMLRRPDSGAREG